MEKIFADMFARQPDEIVKGDYFYRVPWKEQERQKYGYRDLNESELEDFEKKSKTEFMHHWDKRTFQGDFDKANDFGWLECIKGQNKDPQVEEIIHNIAREGIPFMDIASSEAMGLASYILKVNPKTPCLVTDIDAHAMKHLRSRVDENLPESECNISIASFDNLDIPLGDASIDCVTSYAAIGNAATNKSWSKEDETDPSIATFDDFIGAHKRKLLSEVYRILKPGGLFITAEGEWEWEYDLQEIDGYFSEHEKLYGLYTHDEVRKRLVQIELEKEKCGLCDEIFTSAGFEVEYEKRYSKKYSLDNVVLSVSLTGDPVSVKECDRTEDIINIYDQSILYILRKPV